MNTQAGHDVVGEGENKVVVMPDAPITRIEFNDTQSAQIHRDMSEQKGLLEEGEMERQQAAVALSFGGLENLAMVPFWMP